MKIYNAKIVVSDKIINGYLEISDGVISGISEKRPEVINEIDIDANENYILPGFIDIHTNGIAGFDLTNGSHDPVKDVFSIEEEEYKIGLERALKAYAGTGVTSLFLTSIASSINQLENVFQHTDSFLKEKQSHPLSKIVKGLFVEGTFMKSYDFRGAHNSEFFNEPSIKLFDRLQAAAGDRIKIVNVVPEWGEVGFDFIDYLKSKNIICAAGHTGAAGEEYYEAIKRGTNLAVHFLNGPSKSSYKPFNNLGAIETVLRSPEIYAEIIADGYHVDKAYVLDTIKRKGVDKTIIITDSMFAARYDKINRFKFGGVPGVISENREYMFIEGREEALFGSLLTMDKAFENILNWLTKDVAGVWYDTHPAISFDDALVTASKMCSLNPAVMVNSLGSNIRTGTISVGNSADLILLKIDSIDSRFKIKIKDLFVEGIKIIEI